jgi:hypothetical protein
VFHNLPRGFHSVEQRHRHIKDGHIRGELLGLTHRFSAVSGLRDNLPIRPLLEHLSKPLAYKSVIISQEYAQHRHAVNPPVGSI